MDQFVPAHGFGRLNKGGKRGNKGGRPREEFRRRAGKAGLDTLSLFEEWLRDAKAARKAGKPINWKLLLQIADFLAKYGVGTRVEQITVGDPELLEAVFALTAQFLTEEQFDSWVSKVEELLQSRTQ